MDSILRAESPFFTINLLTLLKSSLHSRTTFQTKPGLPLVSPCIKPLRMWNADLSILRLPLLSCSGGNHNGNNNIGTNGNPSDKGDSDSGNNIFPIVLLLCVAAVLYFACSAVAEYQSVEKTLDVWEVRHLTTWTRFRIDFVKDEIVPAPLATAPESEGNQTASPGAEVISYIRKVCNECVSVASRLLLPEGFPYSVSSDYLDYSLWRAVQGVACQINGVLATQALLFAVGLGKGAIPVAAAVNWVLKDGIGYLSKIVLSKYGRHFDVNPKGWRLFADLMENAAFGLEILILRFPQYFVPIGVVAGASRSAAALIQAATRSYFFAGFAAHRNFAEVIAKGEAQGMMSRFVGITLGIALASRVGSSPFLALASFTVVAWVHMYCNLRSYQCVQLRNLNPYRASLVFSEYLLTGQAPPVKEVNEKEPLSPFLSFLDKGKERSDLLSREASSAAAEINERLRLGSKLSSVVRSNDEVAALFDLYRDEQYILAESDGKICVRIGFVNCECVNEFGGRQVIMKEDCAPSDLLKSVFQANYLFWLERVAGIERKSTYEDCNNGGKLRISLDYARREFEHAKGDSSAAGWVVDGLIARPLHYRVRQI